MLDQLVKRGIWQGAVLVIIAAILAFSVNALRHDALPLLPRAEVQALQPAKASEVSLPEAMNRYRTRTALFLDTREDYEFEAGHIPGAWHVPPGKRADLPARLLGRPETLFIAYCSDEQCPLAQKLADELRAAGIANVGIMRGGWLAWSNAGFPVEGRP